MWTLREAQRFKQGGTWPNAYALPLNALLALNFNTGFTDLAQGIAASNTDSGVSLSTEESQAGGQSLLVITTDRPNADPNDTPNRLTYGSGSQWDITGSDFTVECWVYNLANNLYQGIVSRDNQTDRRNWLLLKLGSAEGDAASFVVFNTSGGTFLGVSDVVAMPTNQWVHLAAVRDNNVLRLYRDGVQRASANFSAASGTRSIASGPLTIGALNENGKFCWSGYIDEVLITTACRYPNGTTFTPPESI
jgi:hypothetical protein